jgi:cyclophilin family peptidyl-prolyl cis-trans isomerase
MVVTSTRRRTGTLDGSSHHGTSIPGGSLHGGSYHRIRSTSNMEVSGRAGALFDVRLNDDDCEMGGDDMSACSSNNSRTVLLKQAPSSASRTVLLRQAPSSAESVRLTTLPQWRTPSKTAAASPSSDGSRTGGMHQELDDATILPFRNSSLVFTAKKRKSPFYIAVIGFCLLGLFLFSKSHATLNDALEQVTRLTEQRQRIHLALRTAEKDMQRLSRELVLLDNPADKKNSNRQRTAPVSGAGARDKRENVQDEMLVLQHKLTDGNRQIGSLQHCVQDISRRDAIAKYGAGVHRVQLELEFPDSAEGPNTIVMELAPLELMPHSVFTFMEMVSADLFDGCSFILNAMHVIKAAPLPYDGSSASAKVRAFTRNGLESVAFREYSPDYPHEKYTVGFAADGSPSFYINTQDNTDIHVGDPCFAKIISGMDTVQRLEASPTRNGIWYRQRIGLKKATLLDY